MKEVSFSSAQRPQSRWGEIVPKPYLKCSWGKWGPIDILVESVFSSSYDLQPSLAEQQMNQTETAGMAK